MALGHQDYFLEPYKHKESISCTKNIEQEVLTTMTVIVPESTQVPRLSLAKADGLVVHLFVVMRSGAAVIKTSEYTYGGLAHHILKYLDARKGKLYF